MRLKVLVVDDHFLFAQAIGSVIKELPRYELVGPAVTGPQALAMASERQPDLVLLDYHLPGYSADTLIPRLRALVPSARVIVLTSDTSDAALASAIRAGATGLMTKDKAIEDVVDALDAVASGATLLTPDQLARADVGAPPPQAPSSPAPSWVTPPEPATPLRLPPPEPAARWEAPPAAVAPAPTMPAWPAMPGPAAPQPPPASTLLLRLDGVDSFARLVQLEQSIERLPMVSRVYVREMSGSAATLRIGLHAGSSADELAAALRAGPFALDVARSAQDVLDARLAPAVRGG